MTNYENKSAKLRKRKKVKYAINPKWLFLIFLIFLFFSFFPLAKNYSRKQMLDSEVAELKKEIEEFKAKNLEFSELFDYLETDTALEEKARLSLGLKGPNEEVFVIEDIDSFNISEKEKYSDDRVNRQKWIDYFLKN